MRKSNKVYAGGIINRVSVVTVRTGTGSITYNACKYVGPAVDGSEFTAGAVVNRTGDNPEPPVERIRQDGVKNNDV